MSITQFYEALVEQLGLEVEKSEWKTELVFDGQGKAVLNKDGTQKRKKYKLRRICSESWQWFELFCEHRREMKERRETASESVPTTQINSQLIIRNSQLSGNCELSIANCELLWVGWNIGLSQMEKEVEGDLEREKMEPNQRVNAERRNSNLASSNEEPLSTTTQTTDQNLVPTTSQNLYEIGGGWNSSLSQTEQEVEGDFSSSKLEPTQAQLQDCLKQLRQVNTADDYWELYERSSQLVEEAWKLLKSSEQLRIQQICDEGVDPFEKWKEGERVMLWHPFAENKWALATIKQVVRGACGFIYVLRDDGFGLHLGREKLHLIASV